MGRLRAHSSVRTSTDTWTGAPRGTLAVALLALLCVAAPASAQVEATPRLSGVVLRAGERLGSVPVVLHRVDAVDAGAIDTLQADPDGAFRFDLPTVPDPGGRGEVYFASVDHQGVLYFGPPVATAVELDSLYRIEVFDTLSAPLGGADLPVAVRYLMIEPLEQGWSVTDLTEITVPEGRTLVPADSGAPTWRYRMPSGVGEIVIGGGDIAPVSSSFSGDTLSVSMPLTPGPRQVVLRYALDSLSLALPLDGETGELEVLVREPAPELEVSGLVAVDPVELEPGVFFRRYAAAQLRDSVVFIQARAGSAGGSVPIEVLIVVLGILMAVVGVWAVRRRPAVAGEPSAAAHASGGTGSPRGAAMALDPPTRKRLLLEVAMLEERIEAADEGAELERLRAEREALLARLAGG